LEDEYHEKRHAAFGQRICRVVHRHGATPTTAMTHIAIQEQVNGSTVDWLEKVTDEQYPA
jgi:hypothetical protein